MKNYFLLFILFHSFSSLRAGILFLDNVKNQVSNLGNSAQFNRDPCDTNGTCSTAIDIPLPDLAESYCINGCNVGMPDGPDIAGGGACSDFKHPVAWYHITTGPNTNTLVFDFNSDILTSPLYAVFSDCNTMIQCNPVVMDCFSNTEYWIAVTDANGAEGNFELCIAQLFRTDPCITSQELKIISASLGSDIEGPFKPCEEITFQYSTNFIKLGQQWIHSVFPVISDCFDYNPGDEPAPATYPATGANWGWYPAGTVYWKSLDNTSGLVGINGTRLCVIGTSGCTPFKGGGNCSTSGTSMPAGWVGWTSGSNCSNSGSDPNLKYGDSATGPFVFTFTLKIPCDACTDTTCTKYTVGITGFSDGQTGGWESASCLGHTLVSQRIAVKCCTPPTMALVNGETCSDHVFARDFTLEPQNSTIRWNVVNTNGVTGATSGNGTTFSQTLHNPTNTTKVVRYSIVAIGADGCISSPQYLDVSVFPEIKNNLADTLFTCPQTSVYLDGTSDGGNGGPYNYFWSNNQTSPFISIYPDSISMLTLQVSDSSGCSNLDTIFIKNGNNLIAKISGDTIPFCFSEMGNKQLNVFTNSEHDPISYTWNTPWGDQSGSTIDLEAPQSGNYTILVNVKDSIGCVGNDSVEISILANPTIQFINLPPAEVCIGDSIVLTTSQGLIDGIIFSSNPPNAVDSMGFIHTERMEVGVNYKFYAEYTNEDGCSATDSLTVRVKKCNVGNKPTPNYSDLVHIYPNPAQDQINIFTLSSFEEMSILDINGKIVYQGAFQKSVSIADFLPGVYLIRLTSSNGYANHKFVKLTD